MNKIKPQKAFNHKFFYDNAYRVSAIANSDAVKIFHKNSKGRYIEADSVEGTENNYRAAVKRVHRMRARALTAARVSESFERLTKPAAKQPVESKVVLERTLKQELLDFAQATFDLPSNIPGLTRRYMMRSSTHKVQGTVKVIPVISLYVVLPYKNNPIALIDKFEGAGCFTVAFAEAKTDSQSLEPITFVTMARSSKGTLSKVTDDSFLVYAGREESMEHILKAFQDHTKRFFAKTTPKI